MTVTASNRANSQVSTCTTNFSDAAGLIAPTISRVCFYPSSGTAYVDNVSFTINHRKPARFIVVGASISDGYDASSYAHTYASIVQSNFTQAVCNDSSSYNSTSNSVAVLPEILAHQPGTAVLMIGGNDLLFGYPASQWQSQYSNLVSQLQANGVKVKHCLNTPRTTIDLRPLNNWITNTFPANDIIDTWTPLLQGAYSLNPIYDPGDGVHPNDAGHLVIGTAIRNNLQ
jgi:lysophospholipase L1-like esterase